MLLNFKRKPKQYKDLSVHWGVCHRQACSCQEKAKQFYEAQRFRLWKRRPLENLPFGAQQKRTERPVWLLGAAVGFSPVAKKSKRKKLLGCWVEEFFKGIQLYNP